MHDVVSQAFRGGMLGCLVGFILGGTTSAANLILYERQQPLEYHTLEGKQRKFKHIDKFNVAFSVSTDLRTLMKYRRFNMDAYNGGCVFTQQLINLKCDFSKLLNAGTGASVVARFQKGAIRADRQWRKLLKSLQHQHDVIGAQEVGAASKALHECYEETLAEMRTQFQADPIISPIKN